mmetsp:Transcript_5969/g.13264  ORF Transcript_5969/g.13264 Transcript_5969/m.13264 type:complete len:102 (+) Transcript_5969:243-548(+)
MEVSKKGRRQIGSFLVGFVDQARAVEKTTPYGSWMTKERKQCCAHSGYDTVADCWRYNILGPRSELVNFLCVVILLPWPSCDPNNNQPTPDGDVAANPSTQ